MGGPNTEIEIGFIVTRAEPELALAFKIPQNKRYNTYPRKLIKEALASAKIPKKDSSIHVEDFETLSNTAAVDRFLLLAKSRNAKLIALHTHARKGITRLAVGSFAETTIHRSKINLLLVNPATNIAPKVNIILLATDFGIDSKNHLSQVINLCKDRESELVIFHHAKSSYAVDLAYRKKVDKTKARYEADCLIAGLEAKVIVNFEPINTVDSILSYVKIVKADLVVVSAKAGKITALMGGSVVRKIIRSSPQPVLVLK